MSQLKTMLAKAEDLVSGNHVVFHHVPKCGGSSISRGLRMAYPLSFGRYGTRPIYGATVSLYPDREQSEIDATLNTFKEELLLFYMNQGVRCIAGHVGFSDVAYGHFKDKYRFVTTLREPLGLMTSIYYYDFLRDDTRYHTKISLEEYLETPRAAQFGRMYATFFSGVPVPDRLSDRELVERAKTNLRRFSVVGTVEDMAGFESSLRKVLNTRIKIGHRNKARVEASARDGALTPAIKERIRSLSQLNIELYDFARAELFAA